MKDFIFTIVGDDIYLCETPKEAKRKKYGKQLHFLHHANTKSYYFTMNRSEGLLWLNLIYMDFETMEFQKDFLTGLSHLWPYLSDYNKSEKSYPLERMTFYGGSFMPWHDGHSTCVERVREKSPLLVMPDKNPFKETISSNAPLKEYIKLCLKLKAELNLGSKWIYPGFMLLDDGNPTASWVRKLKQNYPELEVSLAMGFDSAEEIHNWINAQDLLRRINGIYILSREESSDDRLKIETELKAINPDLIIDFLGHHKFEKLSSTAIRNK